MCRKISTIIFIFFYMNGSEIGVPLHEKCSFRYIVNVYSFTGKIGIPLQELTKQLVIHLLYTQKR